MGTDKTSEKRLVEFGFIEQNCGVLNLLTIANCTAYPRPRKVNHKSLACKCTNQFIINYLHQLSVALKI